MCVYEAERCDQEPKPMAQRDEHQETDEKQRGRSRQGDAHHYERIASETSWIKRLKSLAQACQRERLAGELSLASMSLALSIAVKGLVKLFRNV